METTSIVLYAGLNQSYCTKLPRVTQSTNPFSILEFNFYGLLIGLSLDGWASIVDVSKNPKDIPHLGIRNISIFPAKDNEFARGLCRNKSEDSYEQWSSILFIMFCCCPVQYHHVLGGSLVFYSTNYVYLLNSRCCKDCLDNISLCVQHPL